MELLEQTYQKALSVNEQMIDKWQRCISEYLCVKERLETFRTELSLKIMVPLGSKALMRGKLYHTNEILVHLGDGWFTKRSAQQALDICNRRIQNAEDMLKQFQQEKSWLTSKRNIPKMFDVFADHDRQEIIEDYDEEKEKIWRERHKQKVKEYRQNLKKQEQADDDKITDEEYWQKLEELEIQEEFEREIEKSGTTSFMSEISKNINLFGDKNISNNDFSHSIQSKIYDDLNNLDASIEGHVDTFSKSDSTPHDVDEISNVVLLERKSKICENIPLDMKLSYDFIGAFDEDEIKQDSLTIGFANTDTSLQGIKIDDHKSINTETEDECAKPRLLEDPQKISNVILLNRQVNMNNDMNINIQKENKSQGEVLNCDNSKESKNDGCAKIHLKDSANDKHAEKSKYILLQDYKKQLIELRNEIHGAVLKTHDELCQQLDKYDLKEELEHKIMLLQDELNIEDDNIFDSDCSDEQIYKPTSIGSEKSLKKVSFTEKDHTKYLDDHAPDPPLVLHFKHSTYVPQILESKNSDQIDGPHDIYRVYKNCFVQNTKPFKSILKKTTSSILKPVNEVSNTEAPGFGDTAKQQIQKQKKTSCPIVIGDVFEHKTPTTMHDTNMKNVDVVTGPISRFKSKRLYPK